jgi:hypothetical protein
MAPLASFVPVPTQQALWRMALGTPRVRRSTSGGPRSYAAHIVYQRAYQAARRTFGVKVGAETARYFTRAKADRVRAGIRQLVTFGVSVTLEHADMLAAGVSARTILAVKVAA